MDRLFFGIGALSALVSVAAGAFGAHALRARLTPEHLAVFETAARYQMYHALGLLAVAWAVTRWPGALPVWAGCQKPRRSSTNERTSGYQSTRAPRLMTRPRSGAHGAGVRRPPATGAPKNTA